MWTFMPSDSTWAQAGCGLGMPSISMRQARQAATGLEQRVVAEARDLDAEHLGGADDQRALGHAHLDAVDDDRDEVDGDLDVGAGRTGRCS